MARGHQKELARQRNDKNGPSGKPTTQKGTAGKIHHWPGFRSTRIGFDAHLFLTLAAALTFQCTVCKVRTTEAGQKESILRRVSPFLPGANGRPKNIQTTLRKQTFEG